MTGQERVRPLAQVILDSGCDIADLRPDRVERAREIACEGLLGDSCAVRNLAGEPADDHYRPHDLRHSMATYLIAAGVSGRVVMEILGHSTLGMTQRHIHVLGRWSPTRPSASRPCGHVQPPASSGSKVGARIQGRGRLSLGRLIFDTESTGRPWTV
jgi:hypothetical protein